MFKQVVLNAVRHGKKIVDGILQKGGDTAGVRPPLPKPQQAPPRCELPAQGVNFANAASGRHTLLANYLARAGKENLATELRRRFAKATGHLQCGSAPLMGSYRGLAHRLSLMAFVGVGVATGTRYDWQENSFDSVCSEIKGLFQQKNISDIPESKDVGEKLSDLEFGPMIAKGCNAAVYQAKRQSDLDSESDINILEEADAEFPEDEEEVQTRSLSCQGLSEMDVDAEQEEEDESDIEVIEEDDFEVVDSVQQDIDFPSFNLNLMLNNMGTASLGNEEDSRDFDLAVKIMFNYDAESTAAVIAREMEQEMLPAQQMEVGGHENVWEIGHHPKKKVRLRLPPHPNIVTMWGGFVDDTPGLPGASEEYPNALPPRLHPEGCGRNKTLFLVMKRYTRTLRQHVDVTTPSVGESLLLLVQLVEAVRHLGDHNIAHRDIKSDNILVDVTDDTCPNLVLSDFGCCLDGERSDWGLRVPYIVGDISKGGNGCLMAPEIATACPGVKSVLDFRQSDLWAAGTLAYEIFGAANPFYGRASGERLNSATYDERDLPDLIGAPRIVKCLVKSMLTRDPKQRPSAAEVATALHVLLWAPQKWILALSEDSNLPPPGRTEVMRWLLQLSAEVLFERLSEQRSSATEHQLKRRFLASLDLGRVMDCFDWLWSM